MIWKAKQNAFLTHLKCSWIWIWLFWGKFEKVKLIPGTSGRFLRDVQGTHGRHFGETQWTHQPSTFSAFLTLLQPASRTSCTRPDVFLPFLIDSDHINSNCGARMTFMCLMIKFMVSKISNSSSKLWRVHTSHWQIARLLLHSWARWSALELFCEYFNFPWSLAQSIFHITACCDEKIVIMTSSDIMLVNPLGFWIAFLDEVKGFMSNNGASSMKHLDNQPQQYCLFITLNVWFFI